MLKSLGSVKNCADELWDRLLVTKIDAMAQIAKKVMPEGSWAGTNHACPAVYLTFDDGPDPQSTPRILEELEEKGVHATFFLVGANCERYPQLVKAIHEGGHILGNHSFSHKLMPTLSSSRMEREVGRTNDAIFQITGQRPTVFRPPYGIMDARTADCLGEQQLVPVYWGSVPEDWAQPGSERVIRRVMLSIKDGSLIVLHEGSYLTSQTVHAAKEIIYRCRDLGYEFAKVKLSA